MGLGEQALGAETDTGKYWVRDTDPGRDGSSALCLAMMSARHMFVE